jgi:hypothetical protein
MSVRIDVVNDDHHRCNYLPIVRTNERLVCTNFVVISLKCLPAVTTWSPKEEIVGELTTLPLDGQAVQPPRTTQPPAVPFRNQRPRIDITSRTRSRGIAGKASRAGALRPRTERKLRNEIGGLI